MRYHFDRAPRCLLFLIVSSSVFLPRNRQSAYCALHKRASGRINEYVVRIRQIRNVEDRGRIDQRVPQGDRVVEEQEEEQEGQRPARWCRVDLEGTGGPRQILHRPHRAESAQTGRRSEPFSRGVLPVPDAVHGGPAIAARDQRGQVRLHHPHGKITLRTKSKLFLYFWLIRPE